jgi:hypothetical protein
VQVYVIWFSMLPGDSQTSWERAAANISDRRVMHFWDEEQIVGQWFAEQEGYPGEVVWDVYYLYGPEARWDQSPAPLLDSGGAVLSRRMKLQASLSPFLGP